MYEFNQRVNPISLILPFSLFPLPFSLFPLPSVTPPEVSICVREQHFSITFASTNLYTWVERGSVRIKRLAQEHNVPG